MVGCPTCGAALRFDIAEQKMVCDHCNSRFDPHAVGDNSDRDDAQTSSFDAFVYICPSCGAELVTTDRNDAMGFCQYCGGASMIFDKMRREWCPDHIIPFRITKEECKQAYVKEAKRFFVSRKYCNPELVEGFRGVYMPYWSYKGVIQGNFSISAKGARERVSHNTYEIPYYSVTGYSNYMIDGFSRDASLNFDDDLSESIAPYSYESQHTFTPAFLSGFYAESGNVNPHEYDAVINEEMQNGAVTMLLSDKSVADYMNQYNLTVQSEESVAPVQIHSVSRSLNPVWFMSYRNGKSITYAAINGQTGQVAADLPLSPLRILLTALGVSAAIFGVIMGLINIFPSIKANDTLAICMLLLSSGMFYLQNSFNKTVSRVRQSSPAAKSGSRTYNISLVAALVFGFLYVVSSGSYEKELNFFYLMAFGVACLVMLFSHFKLWKESAGIKKLQIDNVSQLRVRISEEARKFLSRVLWLKIVMYITLAAGVLVIVFNRVNNILSYAVCVVAAAELLGLALFHISFQTGIAKRPLPQFNKKGAYYDEK